MTTVKVKFRASSTESKEGVLYYRVIHNRMARQISTGSKLYDREWDDVAQDVTLHSGVESSRQEYLLSVRGKLEEDTAKLRSIVSRLERNGRTYTADKVVEIFRSNSECGSFISFARHIIEDLKRIGKVRTSETYASALQSFLRFRKRRDIFFDEMDSSLMVEYESELRRMGVCPNSTSFYMRNLRAIYNRAVEKELTPQNYPFRHVYTGIDKTVKRAVPLKVIRQLRDLELKANSVDGLARDLFLFSFYTRGMSFIDMAYLKKSDLRNGILTYRRQKTGQQLFIKWEKPMQDIVAKYDTSATPYLLPIIRDMKTDGRRQYLNASHVVNARLKKLGELLKLPIPLTSYVARHAWASIAKSKNIPVSIISEAMGHDSENTTRIYLASLDTSVVDKANLVILKSL
ncbi:tyrosine-type recombinase/integrase [Bacteroides sp. AN502(2024)]|uniref:tyrosine-type recombinase/integrase n=1 Tax=Bacteroides sp. AN502(2024) TaxID=3160599 RepID=UPI0035163E21